MEPTAAGPATVVVSRRVRPGAEAEFERWQQKLLRAVRRAPGYVGATAHPPGPDHPDEWVVVYRFASTAELDEWLQCRPRRQLLEASRAFVVGEPREQRLVEPAGDTVTLVSSVRLRAGTETAHGSLHDEAVAAAGRLGGLVSAELLPAIPGAQEDTVALFTFATRADLDRWLASAERRHLLAAMDELAEGTRTINVVGGFAGWFGPPDGRTPRRWKQAAAVFVGLLPIALLTTLVLRVVAPDLPLVVTVTASAAVNVAILTWLVMPPLTRALSDWLVR